MNWENEWIEFNEYEGEEMAMNYTITWAVINPKFWSFKSSIFFLLSLFMVN